MSKCNVSGTCHFLKDGVDLENKKVPVILSDETEVVRYNWQDGKYYLTLLHGDENVNLDRKDILSLFINHNTYELPIGKFEDVRLEDGKLKAMAVFDSDDDESMKIFKKLSKGFLQSFSVGIDIITKVLSKEEDGVKYYDVTKWALNEASVVGIPAIPNAQTGMDKEKEEDIGVNRALAQIETNPKGESMSKTYTEADFKALNDDHAKALKTDKEAATLSGASAERERISGIMALGGNADFTAKAVEEGQTVGDAAIALLKAKDKVVADKKADFEKASEELNDNNEKDDEELSKEDAAQAEADAALENYGKGK